MVHSLSIMLHETIVHHKVRSVGYGRGAAKHKKGNGLCRFEWIVSWRQPRTAEYTCCPKPRCRSLGRLFVSNLFSAIALSNFWFYNIYLNSLFSSVPRRPNPRPTPFSQIRPSPKVRAVPLFRICPLPSVRTMPLFQI